MPKSAVIDLGGEGAPLAFLHANGYPPECYRLLLDRFRGEFQVKALRLRPLWQSSTQAPGLASWHALSLDLLEWLDDQGTEPVVAVGHSLGAIVALRAALNEPWRFRALVLLDPVLLTREQIGVWRLRRHIPFGHPARAVIRRAQNRRRRFVDVDEAFRAYRHHAVFRELSDERLKEVIQGLLASGEGQLELRYSPGWEAHIYRTAVWNDLDLWDALPALSIPALIVRGAESKTFTAEAASAATSLNDLLELATIEHATHLVPLERPLEVHRVADHFLQRFSAKGTARPSAVVANRLYPA